MKPGVRKRCPEMMALLLQIPDSIFFKDRSGKFVIVSNAKACRSGVSWEEMIGKTDFDFLPEEEAQRCQRDEMLIMLTGKSISKEEELTRPDGTKSWVSVSKSPWRDEETGKIKGIIGIAKDISDQKKLENSLLAMVRIATHDIRNLILLISADVTRIMKGRFKTKEDIEKALPNTANKISRLYDMVGEYLTVSTDNGRKEMLDLRHDIIEPILREFAEQTKEKNIQTKDCLGGVPGGEVMIWAVRDCLEKVYRNLSFNSIRHTPIGGTVSYGFVEDDGDMYRLNVSNSGESVPLKRQESIFENGKSYVGSSGIGLTASRERVRECGGDLWYEDSTDGQHPNFVFTLPKE